jgi:oligogalacturonide transport system permease protein
MRGMSGNGIRVSMPPRVIPAFLQRRHIYHRRFNMAKIVISGNYKLEGGKKTTGGAKLFENRAGLLYILPWFIGLLAFQIYPFLASLYYSFTDYTIVKSTKFIGLTNYIKIFTDDPTFYQSMKVTLVYVFFSVPFKLAFALFIAVLLNMRLRAINFFSMLYYLPSILGGSVGIAVLWRFLFNRHGIINMLLARINLGPVDFLGSPDVSIYTISLMSVWQFGSSMVLFLAALKQIPNELLEAARIDGAGKIRIFSKIRLPLITPIIFFNLIMQTISAFQQFSGPFLITKGGPLKSTYLYGLMLYDNAFTFLKMGYACAQSWVLFIIILVFTVLVFKSSPYWTFYEDGGDF